MWLKGGGDLARQDKQGHAPGLSKIKPPMVAWRSLDLVLYKSGNGNGE